MVIFHVFLRLLFSDYGGGERWSLRLDQGHQCLALSLFVSEKWLRVKLRCFGNWGPREPNTVFSALWCRTKEASYETRKVSSTCSWWIFVRLIDIEWVSKSVLTFQVIDFFQISMKAFCPNFSWRFAYELDISWQECGWGSCWGYVPTGAQPKKQILSINEQNIVWYAGTWQTIDVFDFVVFGRGWPWPWPPEAGVLVWFIHSAVWVGRSCFCLFCRWKWKELDILTYSYHERMGCSCCVLLMFLRNQRKRKANSRFRFRY